MATLAGLGFSRPIVFLAILLGVAATSRGGGSACEDGSIVRVCLEWSQEDDPALDVDFRLAFSGETGIDAYNPKIELLTGDEGWVVYSESLASGNAIANIGALTIDPSPNSSDIFNVKIARGGGPGAGNVGRTFCRTRAGPATRRS